MGKRELHNVAGIEFYPIRNVPPTTYPGSVVFLKSKPETENRKYSGWNKGVNLLCYPKEIFKTERENNLGMAARCEPTLKAGAISET